MFQVSLQYFKNRMMFRFTLSYIHFIEIEFNKNSKEQYDLTKKTMKKVLYSTHLDI